MKVELNAEEKELLVRVLKETQFGGDYETVTRVVSVIKGILEKLDESSSA